MPKSTTTGSKAAYAERRAKALGLNVRGRTLAQIAEVSQAEGWLPNPYNSPQAVHADIKKALEERVAERNEMTKTYIERELAKLDAMEQSAWGVLESLHFVVNQGEVVYLYDGGPPETVLQGWARPKLTPEVREALERKRDAVGREPLLDNKPVLDALNVLLKIAERRAKLLGLDAPVKKQLEVSGAGADVVTRIEDLMARMAVGGPGSLTPPSAAGRRAAVVPHPWRPRGTHRAANGAHAGTGDPGPGPS